MEEVHKKNNKLTQWGSHILTSIFTSHMMVTKNPQNVHRNFFWAILLTFIFNIKIDVNICEPHYVNLFFFVNLLHSPNVWPFDISHLLNLDTYNLNHLSPHRAIFFFQIWTQDNLTHLLWHLMVTFDICQLLVTPGPFEYFCQNMGPSENQSFLDEGVTSGWWGWGEGLGRQMTGLHDGAIFGGCDTLKGVPGAIEKNLHFSAHLRGLKGYSGFTDYIKNQSIGVA